ncbi:MAG: hypothetical protein ACTSQ7_10225 [Alphaproteobacteria bacterium]
MSTVLAPLLLMLGASQVAAAPQILAVIASAEPVTLQCERGECRAEFTVYCIEKLRSSPVPGTAYSIHDPNSLILDGVRRDGSTIRLAGSELLTITTERGHTAVRISLPSRVLRQFDLASVRVSVGAGASLIPQPIAGDRWPHSDMDIMQATGPLRTAAAAIVDHGGAQIEAARVTLRLVNALPRAGRASQTERDLAWVRFAPPAGGDGRALAKAGFERCSVTTNGGMMSLRQCLGAWHDSLVGKLNTKYWQSLGTGS